MALKSKEIEFHYHPAQADIIQDRHRFKVVFAGRRFGKTRIGVNWKVKRRLKMPESRGWWVAPTYKQAKVAFRYMRRLFYNTGIFRKINNSELYFEFINGAVEEFRSGEVLDNLVAEGLDDVAVDECGTQRPELWPLVLRPMLMDSGGDALFIGTPRGMNWFWELWIKGQAEDPDWKSWQFSTYANPYIRKQEVQAAERDMPELVARQEIWAEPLQDSGTVFRNVDVCAKDNKPEPPQKGKVYTMGADLAKYQDFTVLTVQTEGREVWKERFNRIDWSLQLQRIYNLSLLYNSATVWVDSTGVGDPIFEALKRAGVHVEPFQFTNTTKRELIDNLSMKFDRKEIKILGPETPEGLIGIQELKAYQYELTAGGRLKSGAPLGKHDDCVVSLALAMWKTDFKPAFAQIINLGNGRFKVQSSGG